MTAAAFANVGKVYPTGWSRRRGTRAVANVTLQVPAGQVFGLLGPNRAGKTTLVKLLLALGRPTEGTVTRLGKPASDISTLARVGYMHENQHFPRYLTARELLRFYAALTLMKPETIRPRVDELLKLVGLPTGRTSRSPGSARAWSSGSGWPRRCSTTPTCWSSTSRPRASTSSAGRCCGR